jgi:hypothetical protein
VKYVAVGDADVEAAITGAGGPQSYADALVDLLRYYRTGAAAEVTADVERVTGNAPRTFDRYAADYAQAFV